MYNFCSNIFSAGALRTETEEFLGKGDGASKNEEVRKKNPRFFYFVSRPRFRIKQKITIHLLIEQSSPLHFGGGVRGVSRQDLISRYLRPAIFSISFHSTISSLRTWFFFVFSNTRCSLMSNDSILCSEFLLLGFSRGCDKKSTNFAYLFEKRLTKC